MTDRPVTWSIAEVRALVRDGGALAVAEAVVRRVARSNAPEAWITVVPETALLAQAEAIDERLAAGAVLPLAGVPFGVKDNIDVAGLPTTAGCPDFAYEPVVSAHVVQRLLDAGALCIGKTNLDQFATGLVGTRSPVFGVCANPLVPEYIAGGSSSGSAVVVATGQVVFALGTDTAGSGRVPAANCGIVGLKPSMGVVPTSGVVPAMPSFDCVSIFAASVGDANDVFASVRTSTARVTAGRTGPLRIGVCSHEWHGDDDAHARFDEALDRVRALGHELVEIDGQLLAEAGALLYESALVRERVESFGAFEAEHPDAVHPATRAILDHGRAYDASDLAGALRELAGLRERAVSLWTGCDALVTPTVARVPTLREAIDDLLAPSAELGRLTAFVNPLQMCAVAVPASTRASGVPFGVSFVGPDGADDEMLALAVAFAEESEGGSEEPSPVRMPLAVVGAHLRGQPLHHQLTERDASFVQQTTTAAEYRLYVLATEPPKPGLVRVSHGGVAVEVEVWSLDAAAFGDFVAAIPAPLGVGKVRLGDGSEVTGFLCEPLAIDGARDISDFGAWRAYLASL